ncbi:hypothetical protein [Mycobacterium sp.]|uniref:hypothetical protein n=1 Tax=Mycobacterium sp. TaxID=1785 RepID=UPI002D9C891B|nr:hypothetical protein [Mycobacterium sp.]
MARVFSYLDLVRDLPAPSSDINRLANQIHALPALQSGHAVLVGSAAWGQASWRSDIDVVAYDCNATSLLQETIKDLRAEYEEAAQHMAPKVEIILIGAEHEELVERDNLVSGSVPILEPVTISEIFRQVSVRLGDHLRALAQAKGDPWRSFATKYAIGSESDGDAILDLLSSYASKIASGWRENEWSPKITTLSESHLEQLGHADGFATHLVRLVLSHQSSYPIPDRRVDIRPALLSLGELGERIQKVLAPFFAFADEYENLAQRVRNADPITHNEFDRSIVTAAAKMDFDAVERLIWSYSAENRAR